MPRSTRPLLQEETLAVAWSNSYNRSEPSCPWVSDGSSRPTAASRVVWHFGIIANGYSSLIVKLPSRHLTFILFANSDGLSSPFQLDAGDVTRSLFATLFLRLYT